MDDQWDYYSGLPNPSWYDNTDDQTEGDESTVASTDESEHPITFAEELL